MDNLSKVVFYRIYFTEGSLFYLRGNTMNRRGPVLLLNSDYSFLSIIDVHRSIIMYCRGKVRVLKDEGPEVHPALNIGFPVVVILRDYIKVPYNVRMKRPRLSRKNIILRDESKCQYCGKKLSQSDVEIDHVVPRSRDHSPGNIWTNLVVACRKCNGRKRDRTPKEANMKLLRDPFEPKPQDFFKERVAREEWKEFIY